MVCMSQDILESSTKMQNTIGIEINLLKAKPVLYQTFCEIATHVLLTKELLTNMKEQLLGRADI